jgi:formate dehydrogenase subunit gamma
MSVPTKTTRPNQDVVHTLRTFKRFTRLQRWEHVILLACIAVLMLTGLPQKYRTTTWSQSILSTPERLATIQQIHHIAAAVLGLLALFHLGRAMLQLARRKLPGDMLITWKDVQDAWKMLLYLLYIRKEKPAFGKYNFEQKVTYWFLFIGIGIMGISGIILWFPELITRFLPGGLIPAAMLAHSSEAVAMVVFIVVWHFYHVHIERLNLSMFTGWLNEDDMCTYHTLEYQRLTGETCSEPEAGEDSP